MKKELAPGAIAAVLAVVVVALGIAAYFALRTPPIVRNARMPGQRMPAANAPGSQTP